MSRPSSPLGIAGPSGSRDPEVEGMPPAVSPTGAQTFVQTSAERPERLQIPESSAGNGTSAVRAVSSKGTPEADDCGGEELASAPPGEMIRDAVDGSLPEETEDTEHHGESKETPATNKGKGRATDDTEAQAASRTGELGVETAVLEDDLDSESFTDASTDPRAESGPDSEVSILPEPTATESVAPRTGAYLGTIPEATDSNTTDPDEHVSGGNGISENSKGKHKARHAEPRVSVRSSDARNLPRPSPITLTRGVVVACDLAGGRYPPRYAARHLNILPELVRGDGAAERTGGCELHVEWLTDEEAGKVLSGEQKTIDVRTMDETVELDSGSSKCVILEDGRVVVRMSFVRP